jgi:hypothetical protein
MAARVAELEPRTGVADEAAEGASLEVHAQDGRATV